MALNKGVEAGLQVCKRGIEVINFRKEKERLELWKALMNLQFFWGGDSLKMRNVFQEASSSNVKEEIINHMLIICKR